MGRVISSISRGMVILLAIGAMLIYMSGTMFITSLKPPKSFDDLWQTAPEKGMHIKAIHISINLFPKHLYISVFLPQYPSTAT